MTRREFSIFITFFDSFYQLKHTFILLFFSILTLKALDYHVISDDEIIENLYLAGKFRALAKSFYKFLYLPVEDVRERKSIS